MKEDLFPAGAISRLRMGTDGRGITTLVAAAGCPLSCRYCLNPQLLQANRSRQMMSPEELLKMVEIDHLYFLATGGGITFGGGEPLLHSSFIKKFSEICPPEWMITLETALHVPKSHIYELAGTRVRFLIDIKTLDPQAYFSYTGKPLTPARDNLQLLLQLMGSERITVRVPVIPGYVDKETQGETCRMLRSMGITKLDLFHYRIRPVDAQKNEECP